MAQNDPIVLSYYDSLVRQSDFSLLQPRKWLNDTILAFVFEYFERNKFSAFSDKVTFISPQVTQFMKFASVNELEDFLKPLELKKKDFVFSFINDNQQRTKAGGSHWSLLLFHRGLKKFLHYDSYHNMNTDIAFEASKKLLLFLGVEGNTEFVIEQCPPQENLYDCGLFPICVAECLCHIHLLNENISVQETVTQDRVTNKRGEIEQLILELASLKS